MVHIPTVHIGYLGGKCCLYSMWSRGGLDMLRVAALLYRAATAFSAIRPMAKAILYPAIRTSGSLWMLEGFE